jgi:hypothetical protein
MKIILSDAEYNVLNKITSQTKMDCWFYISVTPNGGDCIVDIEEGTVLNIRHGISMLNEGIVPELLVLTDDEICVYTNLLQELDIEENPFAEHIQVLAEVYAGNANGICTEEE